MGTNVKMWLKVPVVSDIFTLMWALSLFRVKKKTKKTLLQQFQIPIEKSLKEAKSMPLAHRYITAHFSRLVQSFQ